nr:M48 family metallopeptidase [Jannaschia sp. Os4]
MALPGGTVIVTDELVRMLDDDADALAGVLAHEVAHVRERHGLHGLYRAVGLSVMVAVMAGETGPLLEEALLEGNVLLALAGTRAAEREADAGAVATIRAMGRDPEGLARFFDDMAARFGDGGGWSSTHPGSAERSATIREGL